MKEIAIATPEAPSVAPAQNRILTTAPNIQKQADKVEMKKVDGDAVQQRRKRYAERKAKAVATRAGTSVEAPQRPELGIMALGSDALRNFFGN